ncbi:hypothetical protein [Demequina globuliformis]|uniref:hypothetical protein n=1 Tax=Demequina globuliformis TaxID=676202 RepID=UPI0007811AB6|nr:hypothetical protein [Demequina globuliformis]
MGHFEDQLQDLAASSEDFDGPYLLKLELAMLEVRERLTALRRSPAWTGPSAEAARAAIEELTAECTAIELSTRRARFALPNANEAVNQARQAYASLPSSWVPEWMRDTIDTAADAGDALVRIPSIGTIAVGSGLNYLEDVFVNSREDAAREAVEKLQAQLQAPRQVLNGIDAREKPTTLSVPSPASLPSAPTPPSAPSPVRFEERTGGDGTASRLSGVGSYTPTASALSSASNANGNTSPVWDVTSPDSGNHTSGDGPGYDESAYQDDANGGGDAGYRPGGTDSDDPDYSVDSGAAGYGVGGGTGYPGTGAGGAGYSGAGTSGHGNGGLTSGLMGLGAAGSAAAVRAGTAGLGSSPHGAQGASGLTGRGGILGRMGADAGGTSLRGSAGTGGLAGQRSGGLGTGASATGSGSGTSAAAGGANAGARGGMVGGAPMGGGAGASGKKSGPRSGGLIAPKITDDGDTAPLPPAARAGSRDNLRDRDE